MGPANERESALKERESRLVSYLEFEIKRIEEEQKRPGWTCWVLGGTIASAFWLLLGQVETHPVEVANALFIFLELSLLWEVLTSLKNLLQMGFPLPGEKVRFLRSNLFAGARLVFLSQLISKTCLLGVAFFSPLLSKPVKVLTCSLLGLFIFNLLSFLIFSYGRFQIPINARPKSLALFVWVYLFNFVLQLVIVVALARITISNWQHFSITELRCAALSVVMFTLVPLFLSDRVFSPIVSILLELRRKLGLGLIEYEPARRQTEMLIYGADTPSWCEEADAIVSRYREITVEIDKLSTLSQPIVSSAAEHAFRSKDPRELIKQLREIEGKLSSVQLEADIFRTVNKVWELFLHSESQIQAKIKVIAEADKAAREKFESTRLAVQPPADDHLKIPVIASFPPRFYR